MFCCYLLERERKGMNSEGKEGGKKLGGIERRETIIKIWYMRKGSLLDKTK